MAAEGITLRHLDLGGGLGIRYRDESPPDVAAYLREVFARVGGRKLKLLFEPGRSLVGNAGVLLTRIEYLKPGAARNFAVVDAAMNDLIRPALYEAWHDIVAVGDSGAPHAGVRRRRAGLRKRRFPRQGARTRGDARAICWR